MAPVRAAAARIHPDEAICAEMAVMAARAGERSREEELDNQRVSMMAPRHRLEYHRIRWEAVNAVRISGMPPHRIEEEYRDFRFTQWEQQNAERVAPISPGERQEMFRAEEMLTHYRAGLPPRDDEERDAYREWRQLDADVVNAYREEVEIPEQLWDEHVKSNGPLSREEFFAPWRRRCAARSAAATIPARSSAGSRVPGNYGPPVASAKCSPGGSAGTWPPATTVSPRGSQGKVPRSWTRGPGRCWPGR